MGGLSFNKAHRVWVDSRIGGDRGGNTTSTLATEGRTESMPLPAEEKTQIIKDFARKEGDSGSPEVQIALLTARIKQVATHLRDNKGDVHNRRGLVMMVSKRNRLLRYLSKKDHNAYLDTIQRLGLRK